MSRARANPDDAELLARLRVECDEDPPSKRGKADRYLECRVHGGPGEDYVAIGTFKMLRHARKYMTVVDVHVNGKFRRKGVASWLYRWVERNKGVKVLHSRDQTFDGMAFEKGRRHNPPVDEVPDQFRSLVKRAHVTAKPVGAGTFGVAFKGAPGWITKVTKDPFEIKMVRTIIRLRKTGVPSLSQRERRAIEATGTSPARAARLPGIVGYRGKIVTVDGGWRYEREDVKPLDASKDASRLVGVATHAFDEFFGGRHYPDPRRYLRKYPWMRRIVQTAVYLRTVFGSKLEDVHGEQAGAVVRTSPLHDKGEVVLYDAQID